MISVNVDSLGDSEAPLSLIAWNSPIRARQVVVGTVI